MKRFAATVGLLVTLPGMANALQLDYYTYNAFHETVDAFTRLALLFSDTSFMGFVFLFAIMGLTIGALMAGIHGVAGSRSNPLAWMFPILLGMVLFKGVVMPTGRLNIYDPVVNAYQPVDGVPDVVILIAGLLNKIERGVVEMVDTASASVTYEQDAGSIDYSLINAAMGIPITNVYLDRSMSQYYSDCGTLALSMNTSGAGGNGVSRQEFLRGTDDLFLTFAKFNNPAVSTVYYADGDDVGAIMTCADAWAEISPLLQDGGQTFTDMTNATCTTAGYDPTDAAQLASCQTQLANVSNMYGVAAGNSLPFLRSLALAKSTSEALNGPDFSLSQRMLINRQTMAEGFGVAQAANQWVPKLRGFITAAVLGLVPLVLLFTVTPLVFRALALVCGLFVWLTLWGICDATAVVMARDAAAAAFSEIQNYHLGYDAIMNTPDAVLQALGVFGKARTMAMGLATVISGALFQFAGYAFTQIGQGMQFELDRAGGQAGGQTLQPEQHAALLSQLAGSVGPHAAMAAAGFKNMAFGAATGSIREAVTAAYVTDRLAGQSTTASPSGSAMETGSPTTAVLPAGRSEGTSSPRGSETAIRPESGGSGKTIDAAVADGGQEVTISAKRDHAPKTPFRMLETQAQASAGGQIGTTDAQVRAAQDLRESVLSLQQQMQDYETTFGSYSAMAARDERALLPGGVAGAGRLMGGLEGARSSVFQEVYRNINKTDELTAEGVRNVARQLDGAAIGVSHASSDPDAYIRATEETQRILNAYADALDKSGNTNTVGQARALQEIIHSKGFEAALAAVGSAHLIMGSAWSQVQAAQTGTAAYDAAPGEIGDLSRSLAEVSLASQIAQAQVAREVAAILGFDPNGVKGLVRGESLMQGHMAIAVPPQLQERVLAKLVQSNLVDPKHLDEIRKARGFDVNFDVADGKMLTATISAGSRTYNSRTVEVADGISRSHSDSTVYDYRKDAIGDLGIESHLDQLLLTAYGGNLVDGTPNLPLYASVVRNVAAFASVQGVSLQASEQSHTSKTMDGKVGLSVPGAKLLKVLKLLPVAPEGAVNTQSGTASQESTIIEGNVLAANEIIQQERERVISQYEGLNGAGSAAHGDQVAMSQHLKERVISRMDALVMHAKAEVHDIAHTNSAISLDKDKDPAR